MAQKIRLLAFACMIGFSAAVFAGPGEDIESGALIEIALNDAISGGMTIDEVVTDAIRVNPDLAGDIVAAAFGILESLPESACAAPVEEGAKTGEPGVDLEGCGDRIVAAAILAGADPTLVTEAAAAGVTGGPGGPGTPPGPGDGNRGGNIASPS